VLTGHAITRRADDDGVDAGVVERDYVLAHVVAQLHMAKLAAGGRLVFKGGTALRFLHVRGYRYSADLDFTVVEGSQGDAMKALSEVLDAAKDQSGLPLLELTSSRKPEIAYIGPLGASKPRHIKLDIATDEYVESVAKLPMFVDLWEDLSEPVPLDAYPVTEIGAEKLRCLIQRVQCRDLYDLDRLTSDLGLSLPEIRPLFEEKARAKDLDPSIFAERFNDRIDRYKDRWNEEMSEHLSDPPRLDDVVRAVRRHLRAADLL
jgi:predicted nucleotidyltransferase component of viral defense system